MPCFYGYIFIREKKTHANKKNDNMEGTAMRM